MKPTDEVKTLVRCLVSEYWPPARFQPSPVWRPGAVVFGKKPDIEVLAMGLSL